MSWRGNVHHTVCWVGEPFITRYRLPCEPTRSTEGGHSSKVSSSLLLTWRRPRQPENCFLGAQGFIRDSALWSYGNENVPSGIVVRLQAQLLVGMTCGPRLWACCCGHNYTEWSPNGIPQAQETLWWRALHTLRVYQFYNVGLSDSR